MTPPYAAELRVYEPLAAFPPDERARWERYAAAGAVLSTRDGQAHERRLGLAVACQTKPRVPRPGEGGELAYVLGGDAGLLVCPLRTEVRSWEAVAELAATLPAELVPAVLPAGEVEFAEREHERWLVEHPRLRSHVLTSRWAVPVRWFLLFDREERRLQLSWPAGGPRPRPASDPRQRAASGSSPHGLQPGSGGTPTGRSLVYRTAMAQARRRVARGLAVLRRAFDEEPVVAAVESLGRWLEEFHPRSLVELDYGGLVDLRGDRDLRADDSVGDLATVLAALARGDGNAATSAYDRVIERWRTAHRVESAN